MHKEIFVAFHNESNYGNRFIIKGLAYLSIILLKEFIELNVNSDTMIKNVKTCRMKYKYCDCFLEYINFKDDLIEYKYLSCNKNY